MKKFIVLGIGASIFFFGSCVERSQKYKDLLARADSLKGVTVAQNQELESMFADINEISAGIQSLREAENMLTLEAEREAKSATRSKQQLAQLKNDVQAITEAIAGYKQQIANLEGRNRSQSAEYRRTIANLKAQLNEHAEKIAALTEQLAAANKELAEKAVEVRQLTQSVDSLNKESKGQQLTIAEQDQALYMGNYLVGSRKSLKEAGVITRKGIFCPPVVASQAQKANFVSIDVRETRSIPLNSKKAKVLSVHPEDSYVLEADGDGNLVLKVTDVNTFWKQSKYLVVMI